MPYRNGSRGERAAATHARLEALSGRSWLAVLAARYATNPARTTRPHPAGAPR